MNDLIQLIVGGLVFFIMAMAWFSFPVAAIIFAFVMNFSVGFFEIAGIPSIIPKLAAESAVVLVFVKTLFDSVVLKQKYRFLSLYPACVFLLISLTSYFVNRVDIFGYVYFLRIIFVYYLLYLSIINLNIDIKKFSKINRAIKILVLLQLPIIFLKFIIIGQSEKGAIGSISNVEGSLSLTFPLFVSVILCAYLLSENKIKYLLLIFGYIAFGIIGEKRAIIFYVPLMTFLLLFIHFHLRTSFLRIFKNRIFVRYFFASIIFCICAVVIVAKTNPTLNPDAKIGGQFDPQFLVNYIIEYETRTREGNEDFLGRIPAVTKAFSVVQDSAGWKLFLGMGPGDVVQSRFVQGSQTVLLDKYGLGYGARTSFVWLLVQLGILGVISFVFWQWCLLSTLLRLFKNKQAKYGLIPSPLFVGFIGAVIVFVLDFFTYSNTFLSSGALIGTYYYLAAFLQRTEIEGTF